jgi:hypothetical protein
MGYWATEYIFSGNLWLTSLKELAEGKSASGSARGCISTSKARSAQAQNSDTFVPISCLPAKIQHPTRLATGYKQTISICEKLARLSASGLCDIIMA